MGLSFFNRWVRKLRSHYPEKASASDFKDTAALQFRHSDVGFDLFIENRFSIYYAIPKIKMLCNIRCLKAK